MEGDFVMNEELLEYIKTVPNKVFSFVENTKRWLSESGENRVYLYGAGKVLPHYINILRAHSIPITAILDTYKTGEFQGIRVEQYSNFLEENPAPEHCRIVLSLVACAEEVASTLRRYFPEDCIFSFDSLGGYSNMSYKEYKEYKEYMESHWKELQQFSESLQDEFSRRTLEMVLRGRISGDMSYFRACCVPDQYYPKGIIRFHGGEVFVELGSNDGSDLREFICRCPAYSSAWCFEPEEDCLPLLEEIRAQEQSAGRTVHILPYGAWDTETELRFFKGAKDSDGSFSNDAGAGYTLLKTATVDHAVTDPITYMKMDIEGAELKALHGAREQIVKNRPKLAVCVYHKSEDLLDIWSYLRELVPEYRFYLRHHTAGCWETVLYALADD